MERPGLAVGARSDGTPFACEKSGLNGWWLILHYPDHLQPLPGLGEINRLRRPDRIDALRRLRQALAKLLAALRGDRSKIVSTRIEQTLDGIDMILQLIL